MFPIGPIAFVLGIVGLFLGLIIGIIYRKHIAEAKVGVAEDRAKKIVEDAEKNEETNFPKQKDVLFRRKKLSTEKPILTNVKKNR